MEKKWYKVSFFAPMTAEDVETMDSSLYAAMEEMMNIYGCEGLSIKEDITQQRFDYDDYEEYDEDIIELHDEDWEYDDADGAISVYKKVFEDQNMKFPKGHIKFCFVDEDDKPISEYILRDKDDEKFYFDYIG